VDAVVIVLGPQGRPLIQFADFHRLPGSEPERDNVIDRGDLTIEVPARPEGRASHYLKVRDRQSYEFALVSVAAAVATEGRRIRSARLALGAVAHKPWRLAAAEGALNGASLDDGDALKSAIAKSFADARRL
jgi:xanthine dehydrogenase YagS FAD-binding subunit